VTVSGIVDLPSEIYNSANVFAGIIGDTGEIIPEPKSSE
jgi:hypothetical protein